MGLKVNPNDINDNVKEAAKLKKKLNDAIVLKKQILQSFDAKMKRLQEAEKDMAEIVQTAEDRCRYHAILKREVEDRIAGKRMASLEKDDDRRVQEFIDVVKEKDTPAFEKLLRDFEGFLKDIKDALK